MSTARRARLSCGHWGLDSGAVALGSPSLACSPFWPSPESWRTTTFTAAKSTGVGLIGFYGFAGARLSGAGLPVAVMQALAVALIGALLIALKALVH